MARWEPTKPGMSYSLTHGRHAVGARQVRRGFAFSREQDLAFALGWPHLKLLHARHPDDRLPAAQQARRARSADYGLDYPRGIAALRVRQRAGERSVAELVAECVERPGPPGQTYETLQLCEALCGPDLVVGAVVEALERWSGARLAEVCSFNHLAAHYLGFGLLRLREAGARKARARLEAILARATRRYAWPSVARVLDLALHGAEGARRSGRRGRAGIHPWCLLHVTDSPELVRAEVLRHRPDHRFFPYVRLAFLGGEEVVDAYARHWRELTERSDQVALVREFGAVRSERVAALMLELAAESRARGEARAWLSEHAVLARPILERAAARRSKAGLLARQLLQAAR